LFSRFLFVGNCLTLTLPCSGVVLGVLTTYRKPFSVSQTSVTSDIHQTLDVQLDLRLQHAFGLELFGDDVTDGGRFFIIPLSCFFVYRDTGLAQDRLCGASSYSEDIGKSDFTALIVWYVYTRNSSHD